MLCVIPPLNIFVKTNRGRSLWFVMCLYSAVKVGRYAALL